MGETWGIRICFGCAERPNPNAKGTVFIFSSKDRFHVKNGLGIISFGPLGKVINVMQLRLFEVVLWHK